MQSCQCFFEASSSACECECNLLVCRGGGKRRHASQIIKACSCLFTAPCNTGLHHSFPSKHARTSPGTACLLAPLVSPTKRAVVSPGLRATPNDQHARRTPLVAMQSILRDHAQRSARTADGGCTRRMPRRCQPAQEGPRGMLTSVGRGASGEGREVAIVGVPRRRPNQGRVRIHAERCEQRGGAHQHSGSRLGHDCHG